MDTSKWESDYGYTPYKVIFNRLVLKVSEICSSNKSIALAIATYAFLCGSFPALNFTALVVAYFSANLIDKKFMKDAV